MKQMLGSDYAHHWAQLRDITFSAIGRIVAVAVAGWDVDPKPTACPAGTRLTEVSVSK